MRDDQIGTKSKLLQGLGAFCKTHYEQGGRNYEKMRALIQSQSPKTLVISCSDSRVSPEIIFGVEVGELFGEQQVAALVLPYDAENAGKNSVAASVEYGIEHLGVEEVIVMGHTKCGGVRALLATADSGAEASDPALSDAQKWVLNARDAVLDAKNAGVSERALIDVVEEYSIIWSVNNLKEYPSVKAGLQNGRVVVRGWQFDLQNGCIREYNKDTGGFEAVDMP